MCFLCDYESLNFDPKHLYNKTDMMLACTWNPKAGKAEIGEYRELLGQPL